MVAFVVLALLTGPVFGQAGLTATQVIDPAAPAQPAPGEGAEASKPGSVEGQVFSALTGEPLKRVNVMLLPMESRPGSVPFSASTDAAGRFHMQDIAPGRYRVAADRTGYVRMEFGSRRPGAPGTGLSISPGQEMKNVDFRLQPHAVIAGRVVDEEGEPLAHVSVTAQTWRYMQGKRQLMPSGGASTNDLGEYRIFGLPPGRYFISAVMRNRHMGWNAVDAGPANRGAKPEEGFAPTYYPATSDVSTAQQVEAASGRPVTSVDIRLRMVPTVRVRGRILNAGNNPMARPMVMLIPRDAGYMSFDRNLTSAARAPDGRFEIRGVSPGAYYLAAQLFESEKRQFARIPLDVGKEGVEGIDLTVSPGQDVPGVIRMEGDEPVDPTTIRLLLEPVTQVPFGPGGGIAAVNENGTFTVRNVVPDNYRVRAMGGTAQVYVKSVSASGQPPAQDGEITIQPGAAPSLTVVLSALGGQITGTVKDDKDAPARAAMVVVVPDSSKRDQQHLFKFANTDQYGSYTLSALPPGRYKLFAWDNVEMGQWMDPEFLSAWESKGRAVTVEDRSKLGEDLPLLVTGSTATQ